MAIALLKSSSLLVALLVFFSFSQPSSSQVEIQISRKTLQQQCSTTMNEKVCIDMLNNRATRAALSLYGVAKVSLRLSLSHATDTRDFIIKMQETELKIQEQLRTCLESYAMIVAATYHATKSLDNRDFITMLVNGQAITAHASKCEDVFKASPSPSYLTDRNLKMAVLGQMIATLSSKI